MKTNLDLSVIIPIHSVADPKFSEMLHSALMSVENNDIHPSNVMIVRCGCSEVKEVLDKLDTSLYTFNLSIIENTTGKQFQNQMNYAASQVTTKYFSLLEFDDEYSLKWFTNVKKYTEQYPDMDMFLPIIGDVNHENKFLGHSNEGAWAFNFSDTLGELDNEVLLSFPNINVDGMVIKTNVFKEVGGYKTSMKLTFNYEFLLRFTNTGRNIMVIPKIGYKHMNMRPDSLFWNYKNNPEYIIDPLEAKFWMETAQKEYYFIEDRNITYEKPTA